MAFDDILFLQTGVSSEEVLKKFFSEIQHQTSFEVFETEHSKIIGGEGIGFTAYASKNDRIGVFTDDLGFRGNIQILFTWDKQAELVRTRSVIIGASVKLIKGLNCNAALFFHNIEILIFVYRDGCLYLTKSQWEVEKLNFEGLEYKYINSLDDLRGI